MNSRVDVKMIIIIFAFSVLLTGCSGSPPADIAIQKVTEYLENNNVPVPPLPDQYKFIPCVDGHVKSLSIVKRGDKREYWDEIYWPIIFYTEGECTPTRMGVSDEPVEFSGEVEFHLHKNPYGDWVANPVYSP